MNFYNNKIELVKESKEQGVDVKETLIITKDGQMSYIFKNPALSKTSIKRDMKLIDNDIQKTADRYVEMGFIQKLPTQAKNMQKKKVNLLAVE